MKIKYLGTGAFEGVPAIFCNCDTCRKSRELGGRNIRTRSQAIINDELLLDFGPDTFSHILSYGLDLTKIGGCVITHSHADHLYTGDMPAFSYPRYSAIKADKPFVFMAGKSGLKQIKKAINSCKACAQIDTALAKAFVNSEMLGYKILPLTANHTKKHSALLYRIEKGGKSLLYAHDTGYLKPETIERLAKEAPLDLISIDCTIKNCNEKSHHLSYDGAKKTLRLLYNKGIITDETIKIVNHFSHNNGYTYDSLSKIAEKDGITVSYDGLEIEF